MSGFVLFVVFVAFILVGGYFKAKKEAKSTPLKRSFNRAAKLWNQADPKHLAMMLASIGISEHSPSFAVYLASTWTQLDLNTRAQLAATIEAIRTAPNFPVEHVAPSTGRNPALDELRLLPQTAITAGLIAAVPGLANEMFGVAAEGARAIGIPDAESTECIFDLMVVGAIARAGNYTGDQNLASLFADALTFEATGKSPTEPTLTEMIAGRTRQYRGISKYALARRHLRVRDPDASLFGNEYARGKGNGSNEDNLVRGTLLALHIRQTGEWAAEMALTGRPPTDEEKNAIPKYLDSLGRAESPLTERKLPPRIQTSQREPQIVVPTQTQVDESWEAGEERLLAMQMFDPPITGRTMIAGCPVLNIPNSEKKYPNFLAWWASVGRLKPRDAQGWSTLSGPGVMRDRVEIINPVDWVALPAEERELITTWARTWPIDMFFD
jgi:hypothetical protein